jgi:hypothetical protein
LTDDGSLPIIAMASMNSQAIILFYAGIVAQAVFLLLGQMTLKDAGLILACGAGSLLGFIP